MFSSSKSSSAPPAAASFSGGVVVGSNVAPKWLRMQAEGGNHRMQVDQDIGTFYLRKLGTYPLNLVTIFGQARKGKSFLMNKLTRKSEVFPVHPR